MMTEPLNRTVVAQSAIAMVIALTLVETVRDLLSVFTPSRTEPRLPYMLMRIMATCVVIALAALFIYAHPIVTGAELPARPNAPPHASEHVRGVLPPYM